MNYNDGIISSSRSQRGDESCYWEKYYHGGIHLVFYLLLSIDMRHDPRREKSNDLRWYEDKLSNPSQLIEARRSTYSAAAHIEKVKIYYSGSSIEIRQVL